MVKSVADLTHFDFYKVWSMGIVEFLNYVVFNMNYNKWLEDQQREWQKKH